MLLRRIFSACNKVYSWAVPWLTLLIADLSPRRHGFSPGPVHVCYVIKEVALEQVFLLVRQFLLVTVIPPLLHIRSFIYHRSYIKLAIDIGTVCTLIHGNKLFFFVKVCKTTAVLLTKMGKCVFKCFAHLPRNITTNSEANGSTICYFELTSRVNFINE